MIVINSALITQGFGSSTLMTIGLGFLDHDPVIISKFTFKPNQRDSVSPRESARSFNADAFTVSSKSKSRDTFIADKSTTRRRS